MNNRDLIVNALKNINPSDALTERMVSMNYDEKKQVRIPAKRIAAAVIAVVAVMAMSITVCAAAGLLDFNSIFGSSVKAENDGYGSGLMSRTENFTYEISDSSYKIELAGVSATSNNLLISVDFLKTDGSEFVGNEVMYHTQGSMSELLINGESAEMGYSISYDDSDPTRNRLIYRIPTPETCTDKASIEIYNSGGDKTLLFRLNFDYIPSESGISAKEFNGEDKEFELILDFKNSFIEVSEKVVLDCQFDSLTVDSSGIYISGDSSVPVEERGLFEEKFHYFSNDNEILCIRTDGTENPLKLSSYRSGYNNGEVPGNIGNFTYRYEFLYINEEGYVYYDINDIAAIRINGKLFELE